VTRWSRPPCASTAATTLGATYYYLRTSIVHNGGVATSDVAKCKIIKWFKPGDKITLWPQQMRAIFLALLRFHTELFKEQFPTQHIIIGGGQAVKNVIGVISIILRFVYD